MIRSGATMTGLVLAVATPSAALAQSAGEPSPVAIGTAVGQAILIVLIVVACLSVAAKMLIVFDLVPREPETRFQTLVHNAANIVGRLRPARSIRDDRRTRQDRRRF